MAQNEAAFSSQHSAVSQKEVLSSQHSAISQDQSQDQKQEQRQNLLTPEQQAEALALQLARTYEELTRLLERNPGMKREITQGSTKEDKVYQKLKAAAEAGGHGSSLPVGEAGRNELPVSADEAAYLLFCAHADGRGQDAVADAAAAGGRKCDPDWTDAHTKVAD